MDEIFFSLDDTVLPDEESMEILNNGDLIKVNWKKNASQDYTGLMEALEAEC